MALKRCSFYKLAISVILLGILASFFVLIPRIALEMTNKTVTQAVRHKDCYELINAAGKMTNDIEQYFSLENRILHQAQKDGINSIIVYDATLENLARTGAVELEVKDGVAIAKETHESIFDEIVEGAKLRYPEKIVVRGEAPHRVMEMHGKTKPVNLHYLTEKRAMQQLPLGIMSHELKRFYKLGFNIIIAPENFVTRAITKQDVDDLFKRIDRSGVPIYGLMPAHYQVFGYPKYLGYVAEKLGRRHLVLLEHYTQLGFFPSEGQITLAEERNYDVVRGCTIDYYEMKEISYTEAVRRWAVADDERNIRINIIQPFLNGSSDLLQLNSKYVREITERVEKRGFDTGLARPMETYFPYRFLLIPVIAGIVAAAVLCGQLMFGWTFNQALLRWGIITGLCLWGNFVYVTETHQCLALVAAVIFPVLTLYRITDMLDNVTDVSMVKIMMNGAISLALCTLMSLCGASMLAAIMTDARFLLEIDFYRGVKLTFLAPLILILILYLKKYDILGLRSCITWSDYFHRYGCIFKNCCEKQVLLKIGLGIVVAAIILYVFIGRTGHSWELPVPQFELNMRYWLEDHLYARPRLKEFMFGHVAFCLMVMAAHRGCNVKTCLILALCAVVGQSSLVETFCHMRSPFLMSVARAAGGYVLGLFFGFVAIWLVELIQHFRKSDS